MAGIKPALQRGEVTPPTVTTAHNFRILDAGCGTGGLIRRLAPRHPDWAWTGIDLEPLACAFARERTLAEIIEGSIAALPFEADRFDAVICSDVLYHLDDDEAALREIFRVLVPGGTTVINVPAHRWLWSYHDVTVHGRRRYVRGELREKLRRAGFADIRLTHWNSLPLPLVFVRRKFFPPPASGSDVRLYPAPIEAAFRGAMALERGWLACFGALPVGSSILAVARKPPASAA
jgi:SAM-dependent methyltransferase